jgi:hypothetical protein
MKPTILEVLPIMQEFAKLEQNGAGGVLHIVLDDENVEDKHVQFCINEAKKQNDLLGLKLGNLLLKMSKTQRRKLSRMFYGCNNL